MDPKLVLCYQKLNIDNLQDLSTYVSNIENLFKDYVERNVSQDEDKYKNILQIYYGNNVLFYKDSLYGHTVYFLNRGILSLDFLLPYIEVEYSVPHFIKRFNPKCYEKFICDISKLLKENNIKELPSRYFEPEKYDDMANDLFSKLDIDVTECFEQAVKKFIFKNIKIKYGVITFYLLVLIVSVAFIFSLT